MSNRIDDELSKFSFNDKLKYDEIEIGEFGLHDDETDDEEDSYYETDDSHLSLKAKTVVTSGGHVKFGLQSGNYFIYTDEDGNIHSEISMSL